MNDGNPYEAPNPASDSLTGEPLPFVYTVSSNWIAYWCFMICMAIAMLAFQVVGIANTTDLIFCWLSIFGCFPAVFILYLGFWAVTGRIVVSHAGIQSHRFGRLVPWGSIHSWDLNSNQMLRIRMVNGRTMWVFGPATSVARNKAIEKILKQKAGNANSLDVASTIR